MTIELLFISLVFAVPSTLVASRAQTSGHNRYVWWFGAFGAMWVGWVVALFLGAAVGLLCAVLGLYFAHKRQKPVWDLTTSIDAHDRVAWLREGICAGGRPAGSGRVAQVPVSVHPFARQRPSASIRGPV